MGLSGIWGLGILCVFDFKGFVVRFISPKRLGFS